MSDDRFISIKTVAKTCGLSTSVLRVWESRYGWPSPKRSRNGYRAFTRPQLDEIRRASQLIRAGTPIGKLVVDGFPRWPGERLPEQQTRHLVVARALPRPEPAEAARYQERVIDAIESGSTGQLDGLLMSASRDLRTADEPLAVLAPALVGLAEAKRNHRHLPGGDGINAAIGRRARELIRQARPAPASQRWVVAAASGDDATTADLAAAVLSGSGHAAQRRDDGRMDPGERLLVAGIPSAGPTAATGLRINALGDGGALPIAGLFAPGFPPAD